MNGKTDTKTDTDYVENDIYVENRCLLKNWNHRIVAKCSGELEIIRPNEEKTDINVEIDTRPTYGKP